MRLNKAGEMVRSSWLELKDRYEYIELDEFVVMPNHFHGIVIIGPNQNLHVPVGAPHVGALNGIDNRKTCNTHLSVRAPTGGAPTNVVNGIENYKSQYMHVPVGAPTVGALNGIDNRKTCNMHLSVRAPTGGAPTEHIINVGSTSLTKLMWDFKSITTHNYIQNVKSNNWPPFPGKLWQRNYFEHIIRNEISLNKIREYIIYNPINWIKDENFNNML